MFIISTSHDKPDARTRRLIRSHAMRGRNTRADRRARKCVRGNEGIVATTNLPSFPHQHRFPLPDTQAATEAQDENRKKPNAELPNNILYYRKIASELSLDRYNFEIKPYMLRLMHRGKTDFILSILPLIMELSRRPKLF